MKKQRKTSKKICRKKGKNEPKIDPEYQNRINALATQFREDQLKTVLRHCYRNVQTYGAEAIMKSLEDTWPCHIGPSSYDDEEREVIEWMDETMSPCFSQTMSPSRLLHDHEKTSKQNALFLIESSEALPDYDRNTLAEMKEAYDKGSYDDVADLAYLHDCQCRPQPRVIEEAEEAEEATKCRSPWQRISELLTEVAEEDQGRSESPIKYCVEAIRYLSRDLTYDNRLAAKDLIHKAIKCLEQV
jgi:hypothetical protein